MKKTLYFLAGFNFLLILFAGGLPDYRNAALPVEQRVDDLLHRLTLEEKIRLTGGEDRFFIPVHVRCGWFNRGDAGLYNKDGLPAAPFSTKEMKNDKS